MQSKFFVEQFIQKVGVSLGQQSKRTRLRSKLQDNQTMEKVKNMVSFVCVRGGALQLNSPDS